MYDRAPECFVVPAPSVELDRTPGEPGAPATSSTVLRHHVSGLDVGIWEHEVGVSHDVEVDEVFVVLSGAATIEVEGEGELIVGAGDVGVLRAGARTTWQVHSRLRKVYVCRAPNLLP